MNRRFGVVVSYVVDVEAEDENHALSSASFGVKYGHSDSRHLSLSICGVEEIEVPKVEAPTPVDLPPVTLEPLLVAPEIPEAAVSAANDIPF